MTKKVATIYVLATIYASINSAFVQNSERTDSSLHQNLNKSAIGTLKLEHRSIRQVKPKYYSFIQTDISPHLLHRFPELTTIISQLITPKPKKQASTASVSNVTVPTEKIPVTDSLTPSISLPELSTTAQNEEENTNLKQLGYKPITSFYHPRPVTLPQFIPAGTPWPAQSYHKNGSETLDPIKDEVTLKSDDTPPQMEPTETSGSETNISTGEVATAVNSSEPNNVTDTQTTPSSLNVTPKIVLEYKPITPFYHPRPVTLPQIIPTQTPWPESLNESTGGLQSNFKPSESSFSQTASSSSNLTFQILLQYKPIAPVDHPSPVALPQLIATVTLAPESVTTISEATSPVGSTVASLGQIYTSTGKPSSLFNDVVSTTSQNVLEYKPITPFYHPHPVTVAQIISPDKPWPSSANDSSTTTPNTNENEHAVNASQSLTSFLTQKVQSTTQRLENSSTANTNLSLSYVPQQSGYFSKPGSVYSTHTVPPGKPWPATSEGYQTVFTNITATQQHTNKSDSEEVSPTIVNQTISTNTILSYKPQRPWYYPKPGSQYSTHAISPGTPRPTTPSWIKTSEDTLPSLRSGDTNGLESESNSSEEELKLFTSSDMSSNKTIIADILAELYNITLSDYTKFTSPSHFLSPTTPKSAF